MKQFILLFFLVVTGVFAQVPEKHPRVTEVEEKIRDEASRYFSRRFPGEAFFIRAEVVPLRRTDKNSDAAESLPYFDTASEEDLDEWDDPTTPVSFLRHRVTKVSLEVSVPEKFSEEKLAIVKDELLVYLRLLPYRDDVRVERKLKSPEEKILPPYFALVVASSIAGLLILGLILRWSFGGASRRDAQSVPGPAPVAQPVASGAQKDQTRSPVRSSTDVRGDVTFHDPLKLMDIVATKLAQIQKSGTFPTLRDFLTLEASRELSSIVGVFAEGSQKEIFARTHGNRWLEAFAETAPVSHETLNVLDRISRERVYSAPDREFEDVLIQLWRMGDRAVPFLKKLDQDEAFTLLFYLPKSISLGLAKKCFPGSWGRLLETKKTVLAFAPEKLKGWNRELQFILPQTEWKLLEEYKRDRELLSYLDAATIEEEKDIYESLHPESFVFKVRDPFYKIFELEGEELRSFVAKFPIDKWALVVVNSSRAYIKSVSDQLDDKKKLVFSNHLRSLDQHVDQKEQAHWRHVFAKNLADSTDRSVQLSNQTETEDHAKTA